VVFEGLQQFLEREYCWVYSETYLGIQVSSFLGLIEFREVFSGLVNLKNHFDTSLMGCRI